MSWRPQALLLGPGGVRGFVELGALIYLENIGYLNQVKEIVGVSIGAIIGLLLLSGYSSIKIVENCIDFSLFSTNFTPDNFTVELGKVVDRGGLVSLSVLQNELERLVAEKIGFSPSLRQLSQLSGKKICFVTVNYNQEAVEYLTEITHPELPAVRAAIMSSCIPGFLELVRYKGNIYLDGALRAPYPVEYFSAETKVLGISISTQIRPLTESHNNLTAMVTFFLQAYSSSINELSRRSLLLASANFRHLILPAATVDTIGFTVSYETKVKMIVDGYLAAKIFLQNSGA